MRLDYLKGLYNFNKKSMNWCLAYYLALSTIVLTSALPQLGQVVVHRFINNKNYLIRNNVKQKQIFKKILIREKYKLERKWYNLKNKTKYYVECQKITFTRLNVKQRSKIDPRKILSLDSVNSYSPILRVTYKTLYQMFSENCKHLIRKICI